MGGFLQAVVSYPTAVFTTLLGVALVYWLLALLGLVDMDHSLHVHDGAGGLHDAHDLQDVGTLASYVVAFGLHGVPFSIALSVLALVSWTLSCLGSMWLLPLLPGAGPHYAAGTILGAASLSVAVPLTSRLVRPLRRLFVTHTAIHNASLVGQTCRVLTQTVDERNGRAEVPQRGANLNIRVWARTPNTLARGATARIVAYEEQAARYLIEAES